LDYDNFGMLCFSLIIVVRDIHLLYFVIGYSSIIEYYVLRLYSRVSIQHLPITSVILVIKILMFQSTYWVSFDEILFTLTINVLQYKILDTIYNCIGVQDTAQHCGRALIVGALQHCHCKTGWNNKHYSYQKADKLYNSKCHGSNSCKNK